MTLPTGLTKHEITRIRRETRRRRVSVSAIEPLSPRMTRVTFTGPELADFDSPSHDDHIKMFFPTDPMGAHSSGRDFTPRMFDRGRQTLVVDFVVHAVGAATSWVGGACIGDSLEIGGPRGSTVVPDDFDWYLLIGDESALPAMGRRVEELRAAVPVMTVAAIHDTADEQSWTTSADWRPHWVHRGSAGPDDAAAMIRVVESLDPGAGDGFVWIAAETSVARALRHYMLERRAHPAAWIKASAYWTLGRAGEKEPIG